MSLVNYSGQVQSFSATRYKSLHSVARKVLDLRIDIKFDFVD
jgi:hypothetical protein